MDEFHLHLVKAPGFHLLTLFTNKQAIINYSVRKVPYEHAQASGLKTYLKNTSRINSFHMFSDFTNGEFTVRGTYFKAGRGICGSLKARAAFPIADSRFFYYSY